MYETVHYLTSPQPAHLLHQTIPVIEESVNPVLTACHLSCSSLCFLSSFKNVIAVILNLNITLYHTDNEHNHTLKPNLKVQDW